MWRREMRADAEDLELANHIDKQDEATRGSWPYY